MSQTKILEIVDLNMEYEAGVSVVKNISFDVYEGEFLSILGASGCGKTTLLRMLVGILPPTSGRILKRGQDILKTPPYHRGMGIVFQNYALFENMTVLKNVTYAMKVHKIPDYEQQAETLLRRMGLWELKDKKPASLSGGQQQRVAIARTMVLKPDVILFDEPLSALDVSTRLLMRHEIKALQAELGVTMIYVTHDQEEAFAMSDRIMVMHQGRIEQLGTPEELIDHPACDYVRRFVGENLSMKLRDLERFRRTDS
ncbi:MAG: ABC transporter ATP-binding protein [Clostridia bacterium]|nr:ABC transporter ATP-binding protein [Clostridia bacterium]